MNYEEMGTIELRKLVREMGLAKGAAVASANKPQLLALLNGEIEALDVPSLTAGGDLADMLAEALKGRITAGIDADEVKAIVEPMIAQAVSNRPTPTQVIVNGVDGPVIDEHVHECFKDVLECVSVGVPVLLVGPAGTGKTTLAAHVAKALNRRFSFNSMSAGVSESHVIGRTLPDSSGNWTYKPAPFVTTYEQGGVHLFDEVDAADPNLMVLINAALANGHLSIPFEDRIVKRHADTAIIAAANTYGTGASRQYVGRNALDAATLDRFGVSTIEVGYDAKLEAAIAGDDMELLEWARTTRQKIEASGLRKIMSTRTLATGVKFRAIGWSIEKLHTRYTTGWSIDELNRVK